jgi:hypothetical protein
MLTEMKELIGKIAKYLHEATVYEYPDSEDIANDIHNVVFQDFKYLILSGEGGFRTEHSFLMECDSLEEASEEFDKFKTGEYKDTYLFIYKAIKIKEQ